MKGKCTVFTGLLLWFALLAHAQEERQISENEISLSFTTSYGFAYQRFSPTFQVQYFRLINPAKFISAGFAYEGMLDEAYRHTFLLPIEFWINPSLALVVSPGFTFNENLPVTYTTHIESRYEFHLGKLRLGPKAKFAFNQYENFLSLGVYAGIPF